MIPQLKTLCLNHWSVLCWQSLALLGWGVSGWGRDAVVLAQVQPDASLPTASIVTEQTNGYTITGGTQAGTNLLHSFTQFDLESGRLAQFDLSDRNGTAIQNAIIRVTGGTRSQIDGTIQADTPANLIFINPQGWLFGANAQLDLNGAIAFSSAEAVIFADQLGNRAIFPSAGAVDAAGLPLLAVSTPIGVQLGTQAGAIQLTGNGHNLSVVNPILSPLERQGATTGLQGTPANLLTLIGGSVALEGATVTAASGQLSIVAGRNGFVPFGATVDQRSQLAQLSPDWNWGEVSLTRSALLDVTGPVGGRLDVLGDRVTIADGSLILSQQYDDSLPVFPGAGLFVYGDQQVEVIGTTSDAQLQSRINSESLLGKHPGSPVTVTTAQLVVRDGGAIATRTFGTGQGGNLTVNVSGAIQLLNASPLNAGMFSNLTATSFGSGSAGQLTVNAGSIWAQNGGTIASSGFRDGDGSDVLVNARDSITLTGVDLRQFSPSVIISSNFGTGDAGNLLVNAPQISLINGGRIDASAFNAGSSGSVSLQAENLTVSGTVPNSLNPSLVSASVNILDPALRDLLQVPDGPIADSGDLQIVADRVTVQDGATIAVRNDGSGDAGRLNLTANVLQVRNRGSLSAATNSGEGGNITLRVGNLQLFDNATISATAGGTGNGGNLQIQADIITALNNSDIAANAIAGRGGNLQISTQGLFGAALRSQQTPLSDITASSNFGLAGNVRLTTPDINSNNQVVRLSENPLNVSRLVAFDCDAAAGQFVVSGQSGIAQDPMQSLQLPYHVVAPDRALAVVSPSSTISTVSSAAAAVPATVTTSMTPAVNPTSIAAASLPASRQGEFELSFAPRSLARSRPAASFIKDTTPASQTQESQTQESQTWISQADGTIALISAPPQADHTDLSNLAASSCLARQLTAANAIR